MNEKLETSTAGIFAAGSVTGQKITSGISEEEGRIAADNAMGKNRFFNSDWTPFAVHVEPEIACVGCFSEEAHHKGFRAVEGKIYSKNLDFSSKIQVLSPVLKVNHSMSYQFERPRSGKFSSNFVGVI